MNKFQNLLGKSPIVSESTLKKVIKHELEIKNGSFNGLEILNGLVIEETEKQKSCWIRWNSSGNLENWEF